MKSKGILIVIVIFLLSLEVSFAAPFYNLNDNGGFSVDDFIDDAFQDFSFIVEGSVDDLEDVFGGLDDININLSAGNSSAFKTHTRYTFNSSDLIKDYKNASQYSVQILADGEPVGPGEKVILRVNGVEYVKTTDSNGTVRLDINLQPGNYIIYCEYKTYKTYNNIKVI